MDYQLFDMEKMRVRSMKDLEIYGENTRSLLLYMTLHMIGIDDDSTYKAASHLGTPSNRNEHGDMRCAQKNAILPHLKAVIYT